MRRMTCATPATFPATDGPGMIARALSAALLAGFMAACVATPLQLALTTPLILQAEALETAAAGPSGHGHRHGATSVDHGAMSLDHGAASVDHGAAIVGHGSEIGAAGRGAGRVEAGRASGADEKVVVSVATDNADPAEGVDWKPADGLSRAALTGLAVLVSGVGYAFLLVAAMLALDVAPTMASAIRFAIGGYVATSLAPALGLPPELPGMGGADLELRQFWWLGTVVATGPALCLVARSRAAWAVALALALAALPHAIGAPIGAPGVSAASDVPPVLAAQFAARSLAIAFVFWVTLGLGLGRVWTLTDRMEVAEARRRPGEVPGRNETLRPK